jgi:hypothetical protein
MNVRIGTEAAQFNFWEYLFPIFGILSLYKPSTAMGINVFVLRESFMGLKLFKKVLKISSYAEFLNDSPCCKTCNAYLLFVNLFCAACIN